MSLIRFGFDFDSILGWIRLEFDSIWLDFDWIRLDFGLIRALGALTALEGGPRKLDDRSSSR